MRVVYASLSEGVHDRRFVAAWRNAGTEVASVVVDPTRTHDLRARIEATRPDVVHAGPIPRAAWHVLRNWGGPLIAASWGSDLMADIENSEQEHAQATEVLAYANAILVDNDAVREKAIALGAEPGRLVQFPWGIDQEVFTSQGPNLRKEFGLGVDDEVIVSVRSHEELYDVETLVEALPHIVRVRPRARLLIGGDGSRTAKLREALEQGGVADSCRFTGSLSGERLAALYRSADVYVSTARSDGTSISLLEAMASGPVPIVTDIPGNRQWVTAATGHRFPVGDARALASAVSAELGSGAAVRLSRSLAARSLVHNEADWSTAPVRLRALADQAITHARTQGARS